MRNTPDTTCAAAAPLRACDARSRPSRRAFLAVALSAAGAATGCDPAARSEPLLLQGDVSALARLVNLPAPVRSARWATAELAGSGVPGPRDRLLIAVIELDAADRDRVLRGMRAVANETAVLAARHWPAGMPAQAEAAFSRDADGNRIPKTAALAADAFFSPPLSRGWMLPLADGRSLLLVLQTQ